MIEKVTNWAKEEKNKKYVIGLILLLLLALGMTFIPLPKSGPNVPVTSTVKRTVTNKETDYVSQIEQKLSNMLGKMEGVGSVSVMVTISANEEKVLAGNTSSHAEKTDEKDQAGGTRTTDVVQQTNDVVMESGNKPYVVKEYAPQIRGVFIVAEGADDSTVKNQITEAVSKLLDVPVHKISVEKKKN